MGSRGRRRDLSSSDSDDSLTFEEEDEDEEAEEVFEPDFDKEGKIFEELASLLFETPFEGEGGFSIDIGVLEARDENLFS